MAIWKASVNGRIVSSTRSTTEGRPTLSHNQRCNACLRQWLAADRFRLPGTYQNGNFALPQMLTWGRIASTLTSNETQEKPVTFWQISRTPKSDFFLN